MTRDQKLIAEAYNKVSLQEQAQTPAPFTGPYEYVIWLADLENFIERIRQATNKGMEFKTAHCAFKQDLEEMGMPVGDADVYVFPKATDFTQVALIPTQYIG
jgi:hypothetical protein